MTRKEARRPPQPPLARRCRHASFGHRSRLRQIGYDADDWQGKPVIGISTPGARSIRAMRICVPAPTTSSAACCRPAASRSNCRRSRCRKRSSSRRRLMYRNFLAMETEELLRSHPLDGAVLMGGCDKNTRACYGAVSMGIPAIYIPAGPMLRGNWTANISAPAPTSGNTGRRSAPATSPTTIGTRSRAVSRARSAPAW